MNLWNRSCVTNLACFIQYICETLDNQGQVDVIYMDYDQINHYVLLHNLEDIDFSENLFLFFNSYLIDRKQFVEYESVTSAEYSVTLGLPQGSKLGPVFFINFINNLATLVKCPKLLFADNLKIYK